MLRGKIETRYYIISKWKTFGLALTAFEKSHSLCSIEEIEQAEKELGFNFPLGYKEFCLIFGSGSLGMGDARNFFKVYCPCCPQSNSDIRRTGYNLIGLKLDVDINEPLEDEATAQILYRLLENGYAFTDTDGADRFFWDLTTYREKDQSYDIYWTPDEEPEKVRLVGRDFFDFIDKFCLGTGLQTMFPEEYNPESSEPYERYFTAFDSHRNSKYDEESKNSFVNSLFESGWEDLSKSALFSENAKVKIKCSYNADNKEQTECLQKAWSAEAEAVIEIIAPSERPNIPRLIEVSVLPKEISRKSYDELLEKATKIGEECDCSLTSFGSEIHPTK